MIVSIQSNDENNEIDSLLLDGDQTPIEWLANESWFQYLLSGKNKMYNADFSTQNKIIGGADVSDGEAPFLAQIYRKFLFNNRFICGGSFITPRTILTAAHCVNYFSKYRARYGSNSLLWSPYPEIEIQKMIPHPDFDLSTVQNDIALFILKDPIKPGSNVQTIDINDHELISGTNVSLYGFGLTHGYGNQPSTKMQKTTLKILSESKCAEHISKLNIDKTPGMFCASAPERSACNGDSGGPLIDTETRKQIGIVSFGTRHCPVGSVNVFTNVSYYKKWIDENKV